MAKPHNALELPTHADLSSYYFYEATKIIEQEIKERTNKDWWEVKPSYCLTVPSQSMSMAAVIGMGSDITMKISPDYGSDEWSVTAFWFDYVEDKFIDHNVTVWSPGA